MKESAGWIVAAIMVAIMLLSDIGSDASDQAAQAKWDRERDSLTTANNLLSIRLDSARAESIAHEQRAESLATVPRTIYITNAQSLTRNASVDSLWLMLLTDPFVAVPETLVHHGQP